MRHLFTHSGPEFSEALKECRPQPHEISYASRSEFLIPLPTLIVQTERAPDA